MFQANGLAHPPPGGTPPCGRPPPTRGFRANKMESRWSLGGARSLGRLAAEWEHPSGPGSAHTCARSLWLERIGSEGAVARGPTRLR